MGLFSRKPAAATVDPVCGMTVDPKSAFGSLVHEGRTFHFCSQSCLESFRRNPSQYAR